jgi:membrane-bound lytic murein transglycosylase D
MIAKHFSRLLGPACLSIGMMSSMAAYATDSPFIRPAELEPDIQFWQKVYTEAATDGGYIHDEEHLDVVYERVTFPADWTSSRRQKFIDDAKAKYTRMLRKFASGAAPADDEERRVRELWPSSASRNTLNQAAEAIRFQLGQSNRFKEGLIRSGRWLPHIQKILKEEGVPVELAALPHVESSFNPYAYSKVGAAGMWQFMRGTGRRFLRIDSSVDERLDPYKSTVAAANFLEQNYAVLDSWPLAVNAYNHGAAGMRRAVVQQGTDNIAVIVRNYDSKSYGFASRNFYLAFLAALEIDTHPEKFFGNIQRDLPDNSAITILPDFMTMPKLASTLGVSTDVLKQLNPSLLPSVWSGVKRVPRGYELRTPPTIDLSVALARVPSRERFSDQTVDTQHRVQSGETLSVIASRYGVSQAQMAELNGLRMPYRIQVGQVLVLPPPKLAVANASAETPATIAAATTSTSAPTAKPTTAAAPTPTPTSASNVDAPKQYIVRRGDSLSRIARKHGVTEQLLMQLNNIKESDFIYEGQVLALSAAAVTETDVASTVIPEPTTVVAMATAEQSESKLEAAEPASRVEADDLGPTLLPGAQSATSADPSDYSVDDDGRIRVQATETLGHYAEWLQVSAAKLRQLNRMSPKRPLIVGKSVLLDFSQVDRAKFESTRTAYHQQMQDDFFATHRIIGSETRKVQSGDSIWVIAQKRVNLPIWLLRQYNPDVDFEALKPGMSIAIPKIEPVSGSAP